MTLDQAIKMVIAIYNPTIEYGLQDNCPICNHKIRKHRNMTSCDCFSSLLNYFTKIELYNIVQIVRINNCITVDQIKQYLMMEKLDGNGRD